MRVLVISDLHLGAVSRIPEADGEFCTLVRSERWDRVVLLGDVFDLWVSSYEKIAAEHPTVLSVIHSLDDVVFIPGNHDAAFRGLLRLNNIPVVNGSYAYSDGGKKIVLAHGDEWDPISQGFSGAVYWLMSLADRLARMVAGPAASITRYIRWSAANSESVQDHSEFVARNSVRKHDGADVVIAGHTHIPVPPREFGDAIYMNTGDFGMEHLTYGVIQDGVPELCGD